jgi:TolB-like protein
MTDTNIGERAAIPKTDACAPVNTVLPGRHQEAIESLAVLPFVGDSGDPDAEYLRDGITESLISNLSQIWNLRVVARSTVFRYKGKDIDPQKAGNDLHVRAVVSGRLLQRGSTLIVRAELMDVPTGAQLWGGQYARNAEDVFTIQDELSREICEKLRFQLSGDDRRRLTRRYTEDAEAYRHYLRGRYHWNKRNPEGFQKAVEYFRQALDKDPAYSLAYAGLADTTLIGNFIDRYGNEIQKFAFRRNDVNTALEFVGGLVWGVRLVEAGRHVQPPLAIHLDAIRTTASLPVEDQFAAAWLDRSIRPQPEPPMRGPSRSATGVLAAR